MFLLRTLLAILLILPGLTAFGVDGIPLNVPCDFSYQVDGKAAPASAEVVAIDASSVATMRVDYSDGTKIKRAYYTVTRKPDPNPQPNPNPNPQPDPKPDPKPTPVENLWGIVIEESAERTPAQAALLTSPKVRSLFREGEFRIIDPIDDTGKRVPVAPDMKPYVERALDGTQKLPVLFLVDSKGTIFYEGSPPATVAEMETLVAKYKAKGSAQ
jgi:hypothetical protein